LRASRLSLDLALEELTSQKEVGGFIIQKFTLLSLVEKDGLSKTSTNGDRMEKGLTYFTPERGRCDSHFQVKKGKVGRRSGENQEEAAGKPYSTTRQ
jgi:hypothetical protein